LRKRRTIAGSVFSWTRISVLVATGRLLNPPDVAEVGRGQDRDAGVMGDCGRCSVVRSSSECRGDLVLA